MLKEIYKSKILTNKNKKCLLCKKAHLGYLNFYYYIYLYKKKWMQQLIHFISLNKIYYILWFTVSTPYY